MAAPRVFTPDEANALVPRLRPLLAALRDAVHEHAFAAEQVRELATFGPDAQEELADWERKTAALATRAGELLAEIRSLGAEVKDPLLGLLDFHGRAKDGRIVWLCYRDDEERVAHWHPLDAGFAARRPISEL